LIENCLTFDVEGFVESNAQSFVIEKKYISKSKENYEIELNTNFVLKLLDEMKVKATFFFLGRVGCDIPDLVKEVSSSGHEIACHSHKHIRIFDLSPEQFRNDLIYAKKTLEDLTGEGVYGFRAPEFSINRSTSWALDILKETGFSYDSSIYPIDVHDVYGMEGIYPYIQTLPNGLTEFPLPTFEVAGKRLPFGGGGYFRLYPVFATKFLMERMNKRGHPCMLYIHPYEVGPEIPRISEISYYRKFRHYYNCSKGKERLEKVLRSFGFNTAKEILARQTLTDDIAR
jgi:polysaccharide deacetylase family protein (PEP-CTERM system associated)